MAAYQATYRLAWCLRIMQTPTEIHAATVDLWEDAAAVTLGAVYTRRIINTDAVLTQRLPNIFYGFAESESITFRLDNSDGAFDQSLEWRLVPVILYRYDRDTDVKTTEFTGIILSAQFVGSKAVLTIGAYNVALLDELLPAAVIDPATGSPFEKSGTPGAPAPVVFGEEVPVRPPSASSDVVSDPGGYDFIAGHGELYVTGAYRDDDLQLPGLEKLGEWVTAPGSPAYVSTTRFSVTDDQSQRYQAGMPVRFKTTASGSTYLYSFVQSYDATTAPDQVVIDAALFDSGLNSVGIGGDWLVIRDGYDGVTDGLQPVPASGADFTVVRFFDAGDAAPVLTLSNPDYPQSTTEIPHVISAILTDETWGLSTHATQTVDSTSFAAAAGRTALAGLTGAVCGALGYDQQQRRAGDVLGELMMMRGMRLTQDSTLAWFLSVDTEPLAASKSFVLGPGESGGIAIKKIVSHGRVPTSEAVRNVVLHWLPLGRAQTGNQKFTPREYGRTCTVAVSGIGRDVHLYNQWIRDATIAEKVAFYAAQKLAGADERLEFEAGQEARDLTLGESITVTVPSDGITGDWQVYAISKTLSTVRVACIRYNADAYGAPTGVVTSSEQDTDLNERTSPGTGSNLIPNPDFSPPLSVQLVGTKYLPHGWDFVPDATVTEVEFDYSAAILPRLLGGHYCRVTMSSVNHAVPVVGATTGMITDRFGIKYAARDNLHIISFYCDATDGVFLRVSEFDAAGFPTSQFVPLIHDTTDTNGMGWARFYGRWRPGATTVTALVGIDFSKAGTYQIEAVQCENTGRSSRRPTTWKRHKPQPTSLFATDTVTFNGSTTYTLTNLIPAGARVLGVTTRVTSAITFGTATSYSIGVSADLAAWGEGITNVAVHATTSQADFPTHGSPHYPTATSVLVTGNGTITSGALKVQVEYTRAVLPSGV